jgi:hypothetical protein
MPIVLTDATTGRRFCIKLYALVMEKLLMGMFIGQQCTRRFLESTEWSGGSVTYHMKFGNDHRVQVVCIL